MKYLTDGISLQNKRQTNMDSLLIKQGIIDGVSAALLAVCDGVGSLEDGAVAASAVVKLLEEWFDNQTSTQLIGLRMRDAILQINKQIVSETTEKNIQTASTLSALLIVDCNYYIAHIGDSRVYCLDDAQLSILTKDDVSETGALTGYIGKEPDIFLQYTEGNASGKTFMVCSDGIYKRTDADFIAKLLIQWAKKPTKKIMNNITKYAIENGEKDNITLGLVKIKKQ